LKKLPYIDNNMTEYNTKNVNSHSASLEAFFK